MIRAEPTGVPQGLGSLSIWVELAIRVRRLLTHDRTWTVRVRRGADDPFGDIVDQEVAPDENLARARVAELKEEIGSGRLPAIPS